MWNIDSIFQVPMLVKVIILELALDILLIAYWTRSKEKEEKKENEDKPLDIMSKSSEDD